MSLDMAIPNVGFRVTNKRLGDACGATYLDGTSQSLIEIGLVVVLDYEIV